MPSKVIIWFLSAGLSATFVAAGLFVIAVTSLGRGYCTYDFVRINLGVKLYRLARSAAPRLIVMSGSNSQSNLDSDELARVFGRDAVNLGIIWAMPLRFYLPMIEDVVEKDDIVLLPLEVDHYEMTAEDLRSPFSVSVAFGVYPKVLGTLSLRERAELFLKNGLGWLQCVLPKRFPSSALRYDDPVMAYSLGWERGEERNAYMHGTGRCDFVLKCGASFDENKSPRKYPAHFTDEFFYSFSRLRRLVEGRGAKLILAHVPKYDYLEATTLKEFDHAVRELGVPVVGDVRALCLPYGYFTDGIMHGNVRGRELYSHEIIHDLCSLMNINAPIERDWPLVVFDKDQRMCVDFCQPARCVGIEAFGEFILDRGALPMTNAVDKVLINGRPVAFSEKVHANKNVIWTQWRAPTKEVCVEMIGPGLAAGARLERVLMEPDMSGRVVDVRGFTSWSPEFSNDGDDGRRFVCTSANAAEAHLTVKLDSWQSDRYRMVVRAKIQVSSSVVQIGGCGYKKDLPLAPDVYGEQTFKIAFIETEGYLDKDGAAEIGLFFPVGTLRPGDSIEVTDLKFERL